MPDDYHHKRFQQKGPQRRQEERRLEKEGRKRMKPEKGPHKRGKPGSMDSPTEAGPPVQRRYPRKPKN